LTSPARRDWISAIPSRRSARVSPGRVRGASFAAAKPLVMFWNRRRRLPRWLARVLGPGRPEMSCEECFAALDRYVELEIAGLPAEAPFPGMRPHLEGCPACREEHELLLEFVREQR